MTPALGGWSAGTGRPSWRRQIALCWTEFTTQQCDPFQFYVMVGKRDIGETIQGRAAHAVALAHDGLICQCQQTATAWSSQPRSMHAMIVTAYHLSSVPPNMPTNVKVQHGRCPGGAGADASGSRRDRHALHVSISHKPARILIPTGNGKGGGTLATVYHFMKP